MQVKSNNSLLGLEQDKDIGPCPMLLPTLLATKGELSNLTAGPTERLQPPAGAWAELLLTSSQPPEPTGPASTKAAPCSQQEEAEEGSPVPRLPLSCCQQDHQKEALFSE